MFHQKNWLDIPICGISRHIEVKFHLLINKDKSVGLTQSHDSKTFIEYSNDIDDIHENPNKKRKNIAHIFGNWWKD